MRVEETHLDMLQNIEFVIVNEYRLNERLTDRDVLEAIQALIREYAAAARHQHLIPCVHLPPKTRVIFDSVKQVCEFRLGRYGQMVETIRVDELLECLKRVRSSIQFWTKNVGSRGYLNYVDSFIV